MMSKNGKFTGVLWHKGSGERRKYLVNYSGYDEYKACWFPKSYLSNALEIIYDYKVSHGLTKLFTMVCHWCISLLPLLWTDVK